jgi:hypothetical protein
MRGRRACSLALGLMQLRRPAALSTLRSAGTPEQLAKLALVPAARNLGVAIGLLPVKLRAEATAAVLACRVLDAYEDLAERPLAAEAVMAAANYLAGTSDVVPPPLGAAAVRDSEAVDLLLVERIRDVRALVSTLPAKERERTGQMLTDIAHVMAHNLESPLSRPAYSEGVLGRVTLHACALLAPDANPEFDLADMAGCVGYSTQLANDLRDGELVLYDAADREELTTAVILRLLAPALGSMALLQWLGPRTSSRGARTAIAYMTITTTAFFCTAVGAPAPYRRSWRLGAAARAAGSADRWTAMLARVRRSTDAAIHQFLSTPAEIAAPPVLCLSDGDVWSPSVQELTVKATFALIDGLPEEPLTGELPDAHVRRMMLADHLAFGAMERVPARDTDAMLSLARRFMFASTSINGSSEGHS